MNNHSLCLESKLGYQYEHQILLFCITMKKFELLQWCNVNGNKHDASRPRDCVTAALIHTDIW